MATFISNSVTETERFGCEFADKLKKGSILALEGDLGSGKTHFVKGVAAGLKSTAEVTSPTFILIHEYLDGRLSIYHFDFFRVEDQRSAERLGLDDYFFGDGVSIIEWADKFPELIPAHAIWIRFATKSEHAREIVTQ